MFGGHHPARGLWFWLFVVLRVAVLASWVDPDTPARHGETQALTKGDDRAYRLVSKQTGCVAGSLAGKQRFVDDAVADELRWQYTLTHACSMQSSLQVFSDEFEVQGRTFHDGNDPRWTAINKNDCKFVLKVWMML